MIAFGSNINIEPLKRYFDESESYFIGYDKYIFEMLNENSVLYDEKIDKVFIFIDLKEMLKDNFFNLSNFEDKMNLKKTIDDFFDVVERFLIKSKKILIINNAFLDRSTYLTYLNFNSEKYSFLDVENYYNEKLRVLKKEYNNLIIFDWQRIVFEYGYKNLTDNKFWYLGRIKFNSFCFEIIKDELNNILKAYTGKIKKVLVLDLDNTLWGGIIGEDGIDGIKLSEDGEGKIYRDFQKNIKALKDLGIILTICSKNNIDDVKEVFEKHPLMVLKWDDFIIKKINWNNKVENIKSIAEELNVGIDSLVFIDDNPVERNIVKENLKEVEVVDFPENIENLVNWFIDVIYEFFPKINLTKEDIKKTEQYKANLKRSELLKKVSDIEDFIKNLNIELHIYIDNKNFISRAAQLTQKTNQFNLTTKRYTENDIRTFMESEEKIVFLLEYKDKFQNEGIIGEAIVKIESDRAVLDTFLMSCRVIGRKVEYTFLYEILNYLEQMKIKDISIEFIPTKKNKFVAKEFFEKINFINNENIFIAKIDDLKKHLEKFKLLERSKIDRN